MGPAAADLESNPAANVQATDFKRKGSETQSRERDGRWGRGREASRIRDCSKKTPAPRAKARGGGEENSGEAYPASASRPNLPSTRSAVCSAPSTQPWASE